jgi:hypothetical protein
MPYQKSNPSQATLNAALQPTNGIPELPDVLEGTSIKEARSCWHISRVCARTWQQGARPLIHVKAKEKKVLDCELVTNEGRLAVLTCAFVH